MVWLGRGLVEGWDGWIWLKGRFGGLENLFVLLRPVRRGRWEGEWSRESKGDEKVVAFGHGKERGGKNAVGRAILPRLSASLAR